MLTYGDFKINKKTGEREPLDTVLTDKCEYCSEQGLDFIFQIKSVNEKEDGKMYVQKESVAIEKFMV